jgi:subtilisin family serine protease
MNPTKYVILHEPDLPPAGDVAYRSAGSRTASFAATRKAPPRAPKVETDELAPATARALVQKRKVAAVAPVMPMRLIVPAGVRDVPASAAGVAAPWGLEAVGALESPFDGRDIVVAILDTGIDASHEAFRRPGLEMERRNFTDAGPDDEEGHGTHCAGTLFGGTVGGTRIGVAPGVAKAMIGKVLGGTAGSSDRVAQAIEWAINGGAHVISMSLGIDFPGFVAQLIAEGVPHDLATTLALEGYRANVLLFERLASFVAARALVAQPTLIVAAAGNESRRDQAADVKIGVSPPAVADGIISVAALGSGASGLTVAPFSNTGARISGPGVSIVSARRGGGLVAMDGTSMATPHVAGVAALWAQKLNEESRLNGREWSDRLVASGISTALSSGFDPADVGAGLVQAPQAQR